MKEEREKQKKKEKKRGKRRGREAVSRLLLPTRSAENSRFSGFLRSQ